MPGGFKRKVGGALEELEELEDGCSGASCAELDQYGFFNAGCLGGVIGRTYLAAGGWKRFGAIVGTGRFTPSKRLGGGQDGGIGPTRLGGGGNGGYLGTVSSGI